MLDPKKHDIMPIAEDELIAILPSGHHLSTWPHIALTDLAQEKFILMNRYTSIYQLCMTHFSLHQMNVDIRRTTRIESIFNAVSLGESVSLLAKTAFDIFPHDNTIAIPIRPLIPLFVVIAKQKYKKASHIAEQLVEYLENSPFISN